MWRSFVCVLLNRQGVRNIVRYGEVVQCIFYHLLQFRLVKRFLQHTGKSFLLKIILIHIPSGCDGNDRNGLGLGKILVTKVMKQFKSVHGRHLNVREYQIERTVLELFDKLFRLFAAYRFYFEAFHFFFRIMQHGFCQMHLYSVVIDDGNSQMDFGKSNGRFLCVGSWFG